MCFFFFKQKTAYEMRISDWSSTCALPISIVARRRISVHGYMAVTVILDGKEVVADPVVMMQGVPVEEDRESFLDEVRMKEKAAALSAARAGEAKHRESLRLAASRTATAWTRKTQKSGRASGSERAWRKV